MRMIVKGSKDETSIAVHFALLFDNCNAYYDVDSEVWSRASPELEFQQPMIPQTYISLAFALHFVNHCLELFQNLPIVCS